ncbi:hypothetical protein KSP39_PZI012886 [Platanthera zijinensis]|uniref:Protein MULTIPLE CHLOROPLAST DIVISION SITE 1 n=1 Tax=Platanthera zijinensis TaxID=2320716 RepID=A0AAP0G3V9_9ASPA
MSSISNALSFIPFQSVNHHVIPPSLLLRAGNAANIEVLWFRKCRLSWSSQKACVFRVKAVGDSINSTGSEQVEDGAPVDFAAKASDSDRRVGALRVMIISLPSFVALVKRNAGSKYAMGIYIASTFVVIVARLILSRCKIQNKHGSVAELVRRGQLRSDRRGISNPLKYEDPFNNPQVKIEKNKSKVEMCGKVYRLAPVTLTQEEQLIHQRRRSRAYQWKRPTFFLKEGDPVPPGVDPDTVRWIPDNHPFASTATELDESLAQSNVFQKDGVPFRVRAEHEALQKKLENIQTSKTEMGIKQNNVPERERSAEPSTGPYDKVEPNPSPDHGNHNLDSSGNR